MSLPVAVIFDLDGTVAKRDTSNPDVRSPYDMTRVDEDVPNKDVLTIAWLLQHSSADHVTIIFISGRDETARDKTQYWLTEHLGNSDFYLYMREANDMRPDETIKHEILQDLQGRWRILATFDDRNRVVDMWRANGITCFQVCSREDGDF